MRFKCASVKFYFFFFSSSHTCTVPVSCCHFPWLSFQQSAGHQLVLSSQSHCYTPALLAYRLFAVFLNMFSLPALVPVMLLSYAPSTAPSPPSLHRLFRLISSSVSASHRPPSPPTSGLHVGGFILPLLRADALDYNVVPSSLSAKPSRLCHRISLCQICSK